MRLINCKNLEIEQFFDRNIPDYAILSHTWGEGEVTLADIPLHQAPAMTRYGYRKIKFICDQALKDDLMYAWVDTCCIDKNSSAELSEAINSMFNWYWRAEVCYAYLDDVTKDNFEDEFPQSRWFTRGWTLQELLAPTALTFFDHDWKVLGSRRKLAELISEITTVDSDLLEKGAAVGRKLRNAVPLGSFCVAQRMSWASRRSTTRVEDTAYCLLGLFGINMPLLYGEGERAFIRLQEEIMRNIDDDSILAWGLGPEIELLPAVQDDSFNNGQTQFMGDILASSPKDFEMCGNVEYAAPALAPFAMTNAGLQIKLPLVPIMIRNVGRDHLPFYAYVGLLSCSLSTHSNVIGILLDTVFASQSITDMGRVSPQSSGECSYTVLVSPLVAAKFEEKNITVLSNNDVRRFRQDQKMYSARGWRHIIVVVSQRLQQMGCHVIRGNCWYFDGLEHRLESEGWDDPEHWNPMSKIYTFGTRYHYKHLLRFAFEFEPTQADSQFSVFMLTNGRRAIIRRGSLFSESDLFSIGAHLENPHSPADPEKLLLSDIDGKIFEFDAEVTEDKDIYKWRISHVNVDVAGLELEVPESATV